MRYSQKGKEEPAAANEYKELFAKQNELFDVYTDDPEIRKRLEKEWGASMSEMEHVLKCTCFSIYKCILINGRHEC